MNSNSKKVYFFVNVIFIKIMYPYSLKCLANLFLFIYFSYEHPYYILILFTTCQDLLNFQQQTYKKKKIKTFFSLSTTHILCQDVYIGYYILRIVFDVFLSTIFQRYYILRS